MAINKNHEFEELDGVKCAIVERKVSADRVAFLKSLLEFNRYKVIVVGTPDPKAAQPVKEGEQETPHAAPSTFTVGVTDVTFNPTNAIFGRLLRTRDGHIVTLAYWQQKEAVSHDDIPYFGAV
jgi:hypothetical protein